MQQYVRTPILRANRAHKAVHYSTVAAAVRQKTGKQLSLRTLQRYGKEELGAKQRRGKKRTADESEELDTREREHACVLHVQQLTQVASLSAALPVSADM